MSDIKHKLKPANTQERGVALVLVLWILVLLTAIAQNLTFSSRTDLVAAANLASLTRAEMYADAAVHKAVYLLSNTTLVKDTLTDPTLWKADGLIRYWHYQDANIAIAIIGESGKIDINTATPQLLAGLYRSIGLDQAAADGLVDAMLDWRDNDELRRPLGGEKAEYAAAGKLYSPANTDFVAIDDLQLVLGMTSEIFRRIEPFITVHSGQPGIDTSLAPREVLLALPNTTPEQVDLFVMERNTLLSQGLPVPPFPQAQGLTANGGSSAYSIQVEVVLSDNVRFLRQAVVRLTGSPIDPVNFLTWRTPSYASIGSRVSDTAYAYHDDTANNSR